MHIIISYCLYMYIHTVYILHYITLHYFITIVISLMYIWWWWWRWWSSLVRPCIWTKDYVYFNWPTSQCSPIGPFVFTHGPCVRIMEDPPPPQHPCAHPSLQNQQCQDCGANKNSGGEKSDSFETKSKSNMSGMSLNRVIPLSICLTFRITRYNRSTNVYTKCYVAFLLQGSKLQVTMCCWPKMITTNQHLVILPFLVPRPDVPGIADTTCFHEGHGKWALLCTRNTDTTKAIASCGWKTNCGRNC